MFNRAKVIVLGFLALLAYASSVSAALFEIPSLLLGTSKPATRQHLQDRVEGLYKPASLDRVGTLQFSSTGMGLAKSEDLLWMTLGDAGVTAGQFLSSNADTTLYLANADRLFIQKTGPDGAVRAPVEGGVPEIWAVMLIGAGLIWSQLRRKNRHSAIRFNSL